MSFKRLHGTVVFDEVGALVLVAPHLGQLGGPSLVANDRSVQELDNDHGLHSRMFVDGCIDGYKTDDTCAISVCVQRIDEDLRRCQVCFAS